MFGLNTIWGYNALFCLEKKGADKQENFEKKPKCIYRELVEQEKQQKNQPLI